MSDDDVRNNISLYKNIGCQLLLDRMASDLCSSPGFILYVRKNVILINILLCATV